MKMKSFAMLAMSGLLAASFAYMAPAMAEPDTSNVGQASPPASDNSMPNSNSQNGDSSTPTDNSANTNNNGNVGGSGTGTDEGSPDTATGDDDY